MEKQEGSTDTEIPFIARVAPTAKEVFQSTYDIQHSDSEPLVKAETDISLDQYNIEAWQTLINSSQTTDIKYARSVFERFLSVFPTAALYWKQYAELELKEKNYEEVEQILQRCLLSCNNIELWKLYLSYIQLIKEGKPDFRESMTKAFEFALINMGMDVSSTPLWRSYIQFLKSLEASNQYEESQKMVNIRKAYQRAVENPIHNLESIWKEYDAFENSYANKTLAKALLAEYGAKYMAARAVYRERRGYMEGIQFNRVATPPTSKAKEEHQVYLWRRLIDYEKGNPQRLEPPLLKRRMEFVYNQCLQCLYHHADIWYEAACYLLEAGGPEDAFSIYKKAIVALPKCLLLHFIYADLLESFKKVKETQQVYETLLAHTQDPLIYIQQMRFARRAQGVDAARKVFLAARKSPSCTYHVYVASATMEYLVNKNTDVARNILDLGLKQFVSEPAFVAEYAKFLLHLNEENNLRVLFERVIASTGNNPSPSTWNLFLEFEYVTGDLPSIQKLEKRRATAFPESDANGLMGYIQRYHFLGLWPTDITTLSCFDTGRQDRGSKNARLKMGSGVEGRFPRPDLSKMVAYVPEMASTSPPPALGSSPADATPSSNSTLFALPPPLLGFLQMLPSADAYHGVRPNPDLVLDLLRDSPLPPLDKEMKKQAKKQGKRKAAEMDDTQNRPPSHDIFRKRQAAKLKGQLQ